MFLVRGTHGKSNSTGTLASVLDNLKFRFQFAFGNVQKHYLRHIFTACTGIDLYLLRK